MCHQFEVEVEQLKSVNKSVESAKQEYASCVHRVNAAQARLTIDNCSELLSLEVCLVYTFVLATLFCYIQMLNKL